MEKAENCNTNKVFKPSISVIMPSYNRAHIIERAIRSVLNQSYSDFELIVVDDGSVDNTKEVVTGIDDTRIRYVWQKNKGVSTARNSGVSLANGSLITFLDSDDEALPEWLAQFVQLLSGDGVGVACCGMKVLKLYETVRSEEYLPEKMGPAFDNQPGLFLAGSFALRRELIEAIGGYVDELTYSENTELALRLIPYCRQHGWRIKCISSPQVMYRQEPFGGARNLENLWNSLESSEYLLHHHGDRLKKDRKRYGQYLSAAGVRAARVGEYGKARRFFNLAVFAHPANPRHYGRFFLSLVPRFSRRVWMRQY